MDKWGCNKKENDLRVRSIPMIHQHTPLLNINLKNINILAFWRLCDLRANAIMKLSTFFFIESLIVMTRRDVTLAQQGRKLHSWTIGINRMGFLNTSSRIQCFKLSLLVFFFLNLAWNTINVSNWFETWYPHNCAHSLSSSFFSRTCVTPEIYVWPQKYRIGILLLSLCSPFLLKTMIELRFRLEAIRRKSSENELVWSRNKLCLI